MLSKIIIPVILLMFLVSCAGVETACEKDKQITCPENIEDLNIFDYKTYRPATYSFLLKHAEVMDKELGRNCTELIYEFMWELDTRMFEGVAGANLVGKFDEYPGAEFMKGYYRYIIKEGPRKYKRQADKIPGSIRYSNWYQDIPGYMAELKDEKAVPVLLDAIKNQKYYYTQYAEALVKIKTKEAIDGLFRLWKDETLAQKKRDEIRLILRFNDYIEW